MAPLPRLSRLTAVWCAVGALPWLVVNALWIQVPLLASRLPRGYASVPALALALQGGNAPMLVLYLISSRVDEKRAAAAVASAATGNASAAAVRREAWRSLGVAVVAAVAVVVLTLGAFWRGWAVQLCVSFVLGAVGSSGNVFVWALAGACGARVARAASVGAALAALAPFALGLVQQAGTADGAPRFSPEAFFGCFLLPILAAGAFLLTLAGPPNSGAPPPDSAAACMTLEEGALPAHAHLSDGELASSSMEMDEMAEMAEHPVHEALSASAEESMPLRGLASQAEYAPMWEKYALMLSTSALNFFFPGVLPAMCAASGASFQVVYGAGLVTSTAARALCGTRAMQSPRAGLFAALSVQAVATAALLGAHWRCAGDDSGACGKSVASASMAAAYAILCAAFGWASTVLYVRAASLKGGSGGPVATSRRLAAVEQAGGIIGACTALLVAALSRRFRQAL